jgi:hypothetical protein
MKSAKKILFITDDLSTWGHKQYTDHLDFFNKESGEDRLGLKFDIIASFEDFKTCNGYDLVMIDYGLVGNSENAITILQKIYNTGIKMAWVGGLGGSNHYNEDARKLYPRQKFLHNLPSAPIGIDDVLDMIYEIFED